MLHANVGGVDRVARVAGGALFLALGFARGAASGASPGLTLAVAGLLVLISGLARFCILYVPLGISTARARRSPAP